MKSSFGNRRHAVVAQEQLQDLALTARHLDQGLWRNDRTVAPFDAPSVWRVASTSSAIRA
jgi:hypothetical protein